MLEDDEALQYCTVEFVSSMLTLGWRNKEYGNTTLCAFISAYAMSLCQYVLEVLRAFKAVESDAPD